MSDQTATLPSSEMHARLLWSGCQETAEMVAGVLRWFNALRWLTSQSTSKLSVPALTKYSPTGSHCLAAEAQTKPICPSLSRQEMGSVRKVMLQAIAAASLPLGEKETRLMGAEWGPLRLKATDQDRRSNMETSFSVPGTANRLPPSGCHAVPLRLAEVTST